MWELRLCLPSWPPAYTFPRRLGHHHDRPHSYPRLAEPLELSNKMSDPNCCVTGFEWDGEPTGHNIAFPTTANQAYVTGSSSSAAILFICDLFGWGFRNNRLLADHLARSVGATVYVPDLYGQFIPMSSKSVYTDFHGYWQLQQRPATYKYTHNPRPSMARAQSG